MTPHSLRPNLRFALETGILDAPAGIVRDGDTWHLFYQYRQDVNAPARWGHTYAEDGPFEWFECDDVLAPEGEELTLRAGTVLPTPAGASLYFTSVREHETAVAHATYTDLKETCQLSDDPLTLDSAVTRHGDCVVSLDTPVGAFERFRSPCVVPDWAAEDREEGTSGLIMLALTGPADKPTPVVLRSADGKVWDFEGPLEVVGDAELPASSDADAPLAAVVAPRIIRLRDEVDGNIYDVLLITLERDGIDISGYVVGRLEGAAFHVTSGFRRVDYGHDFTRPRNTNYVPGTVSEEQRYDHAILFGLVNGVGRQDDPTNHPTWTEEGWANVLSLPRVVTLQGGTLYQTPPKGLPEAIKESAGARSWIGMLEVPTDRDSDAAVTVTLKDAQGTPAAVITHAGHELRLDRSSSTAFDNRFAGEAPAVAPLAEGDSDSLTIIVDGSVVEVYADGGQVAMTSRVYFDGGFSECEATVSGDASIERSWENRG
ncbi:GH32 C-terminal domain-containing protein [Corynebacterium incognita]|uniref:beta-fructofuranosidase n=1 Tax=Corynebacterium incognita TaxID=2754725 RepID=A0A7G7CP04_9CORY|nr:GH32 C-terminal domain-containing protein [Corynebacterium incognita]QNE89320.1 GH32 C-terminal domain-containing protein [Corynebacterium incognita]